MLTKVTRVIYFPQSKPVQLRSAQTPDQLIRVPFRSPVTVRHTCDPRTTCEHHSFAVTVIFI